MGWDCAKKGAFHPSFSISGSIQKCLSLRCGCLGKKLLWELRVQSVGTAALGAVMPASCEDLKIQILPVHGSNKKRYGMVVHTGIGKDCFHISPCSWSREERDLCSEHRQVPDPAISSPVLVGCMEVWVRQKTPHGIRLTSQTCHPSQCEPQSLLATPVCHSCPTSRVCPYFIFASFLQSKAVPAGLLPPLPWLLHWPGQL